MVKTIEEIRKEIEKIIEGISIKEIRTKVYKKRRWFRGSTNVDPENNYWKGLEDKLEDPSTKKLIRSIRKLAEDELVEYDERINQILNLLGYEEQFPDFEGINNPDVHALPGEEKIYWTELEKTLKKSRNDGMAWSLADMVDIIIEVKKHLGISDDELNELTASADLAMPTKQVEGINTSLTLKETIKICNTLLPHLTPSRILDKLIDEANRYQALNVATNDIIREKGEIDKGKLEKLKNSQEKHTDYEAIKNELERWRKLGQTPEKIAKDIKDLQSRPATEGSGTGTSSPVDKQKIADLIKVIEKQNQAIRKYGDAQDNFTGDYSWKAEIIDVSKLKN